MGFTSRALLWCLPALPVQGTSPQRGGWPRRLVWSFDGSHRYANRSRHEDGYPYLVLLRRHREDYCGGTLIRPDWVLTAAHCTSTSQKVMKHYSVLVAHRCPWARSLSERDKVLCEDGAYVTDGSCAAAGHGNSLQCPANKPVMCGDKTCVQEDCRHNGGRRLCLEGQAASKVDLVVVHPAFDPIHLYNDIALLHLARPLEGLPLAKLQNRSGSHQGSIALIAGWGSVDEHCEVQEGLLMEGETRIAGADPCRRADQFFNKSELICSASLYQSSISGAGCGDSGGPLLVEEGGEYVQVGVVALTLGDRDIFTRVYAYMGWIGAVIASPPLVSMLTAPFCHGACCDNADYVDPLGYDCYDWFSEIDEGGECWSEFKLLQKCPASCMQCPVCSTTNAGCCDDPTFLDSQNYGCNTWRGFDCTRVKRWGYPADEAALIQRKCPAMCGTCEQGHDCFDDSYFFDEQDYFCDAWALADCFAAHESFGYTPRGEEDLLRHCPLTCNNCPTTTASTSTSFTILTSTESTTTEPRGLMSNAEVRSAIRRLSPLLFTALVAMQPLA